MQGGYMMTGIIETTMESQKLESIFTLPSYFHNRMVMVTVKLVDACPFQQDESYLESSENISDSFGMWKDYQEMDDVDSYIRNMRKGRTFL
jgi:hypothetical protein